MGDITQQPPDNDEKTRLKNSIKNNQCVFLLLDS